ADELAGRERRVEVTGVGTGGAAGDGPAGLAAVLGLDGEQPADDVRRGPRVRPDEALGAQTPPGDVVVGGHASLLGRGGRPYGAMRPAADLICRGATGARRAPAGGRRTRAAGRACRRSRRRASPPP